MLLLWRAWWRSATAAVTQTAAVPAAVADQVVNAAAAITQSAATASDFAHELFNAQVAATQAAARPAAIADERFTAQTSATQVASTVIAIADERFNATPAVTQSAAAASVAGAVTNPVGVIPTISTGGGGVGRHQAMAWYPTVWPSDLARPVSGQAEPMQARASVAAAGTVRRRVSVVAAIRQTAAIATARADVIDPFETVEDAELLGIVEEKAFELACR